MGSAVIDDNLDPAVLEDETDLPASGNGADLLVDGEVPVNRVIRANYEGVLLEFIDQRLDFCVGALF